MQLVAYGAQDIYLTGNPQITFFKVVYRRHTNFSMECIRQTFNGAAGDGRNVTATISRNGDLVYKLYVTSAVTDSSITNGCRIVSDAELEIGGQRIDRHFNEWNEIWYELSTDESKALGLKSMMGCIGTNGATGTGVDKIQVPLNFWFCRNPGLALPLIALQYHEVKVKIQLGVAGTGAASAELWADYIYLDTDERRRFAQVSHEYLIEQVQRQTLDASTTTNRLNFNHPVKELIWTGSGYGRGHIKLNGHDRFALQEEEYFQLRQPFDYHTAVPKQNLPQSARAGLSSRQAVLDVINNTAGGGEVTNAVSTGFYTASPAAATEGAFSIAGSVLSIGLGAGVVLDNTVANMNAGTQLAIVCSTNDPGDPATQGRAGQVYFTTITTPPQDNANATGQADIGITRPTATNGDTLQDTGTNTTATFNIFAFTNDPANEARTSQLTSTINVYSFALKPEEHQPSGTCNFSRIDNAQLVTTGTITGTMYAVNYNVLRIMSGMGGLAYSN